MPVPPLILYLHGFASSPKSTKVGYFTERLRERGVALVCPDFNAPDFRSLTVTRMLEQLEGEVARLILLAPAVMFAKPGHHLLPQERIDEWRRRGSLPFFHYADNAELPLDYAFYEDSLRYDAFNTVMPQPTLVFQGLRDASVDQRTVEEFARSRSNVTLSLLDDDHQLIASLPRMWHAVQPFLGIVE
jgi:hypothetical protein